MGLILDYSGGQTPLDEDEKEGLLIQTIATREELDEFEQLNIEEALQWVITKSFNAETVLTEKFICNLHKRMYGSVWSWAGKFRKTNKNLGVDKWQIPLALKTLCDDSLFWMKNNTYFPDEIAIRFKHRLVSIHCFPNGNGRHNRLMADIIVNNIYQLPVFSWGTNDIMHQYDSRSSYLMAVKEADNQRFQPLIEFARS
jgi:Fic-DOC domain mobile mystery protein B